VKLNIAIDFDEVKGFSNESIQEIIDSVVEEEIRKEIRRITFLVIRKHRDTVLKNIEAATLSEIDRLTLK
jgi:hypothetical protein